MPRHALEKARDTFARYAALHRAKEDPDAVAKAVRNESLAAEMSAAIQQFDLLYGTPGVTELIADWVRARNLHEGSRPKDQLAKLVEEVGELAGGIARGKTDVVLDSIGDVAVVLTALAMQHRTTLPVCMSMAYREIKDRKGRMADGVFIKEEDDV